MTTFANGKELFDVVEHSVFGALDAIEPPKNRVDKVASSTVLGFEAVKLARLYINQELTGCVEVSEANRFILPVLKDSHSLATWMDRAGEIAGVDAESHLRAMQNSYGLIAVCATINPSLLDEFVQSAIMRDFWPIERYEGKYKFTQLAQEEINLIKSEPSSGCPALRVRNEMNDIVLKNFWHKYASWWNGG